MSLPGDPSLRELRDDFGMSVKEIFEQYHPDESRLIRELDLTPEQLKEALRETKSLRGSAKTGVTPKEVKKAFKSLKEKVKTPESESSVIDRYAPIEKPNKPVRRGTPSKTLDVPMTSEQAILDRLAKSDVRAVVNVAVPKTVINSPLKLGRNSEISEKDINDALNSKKEVELSFGRYYDSFVPGVPTVGFMRLCSFLSRAKNYNQVAMETSITEIAGDIRKVNGSYERKVREAVYDSSDFEFRISVSKETPLTAPAIFNPTITRIRERRSFLSKTKRWRVDLTEVKQESRGRSEVIFEIEIELLKQTPLLELIEEAKALLMIVWDVDSEDKLMRKEEFKNFVVAHNTLLKMPTINGRLTSGYWNRPVDLNIRDLSENGHEFAITSKLDGERRLLFFLDSGVYENTRAYIAKIGPPSIYLNIVVDAEYYPKTKTYWIFDVLVVDGIDLRDEPLEIRDKVRLKFTNIKLWQGASIEISKKYFYPSKEVSVFNCITEAARWQTKNKELDFDGFILQPLGGYNKEPKKWKPVGLTSIDFLLTPTDKAGEYTYEVFDTKARKHIPFYRKNISKTISFNLDAYLETISMAKGCVSSQFVAECLYNGDGAFEVHRLRLDRVTANELETAKSVWNHILRPIDPNTFFGNDLKIMRYTHNRTKEFLLKNFQGLKTIIDVGTGQGGDLEKWSTSGFEKIYIVEPDPNGDKLAEMESRYKTGKYSFSLEVLQNEEGPVGIEATQDIVEQLSQAETKPQGMAAFFSLTFLGGSKKLIRNTIDTIFQTITRPGQKVVGIVMDGEETNKLLDRVRDKDNPAEYVATYGQGKPIFSIKETGITSKITTNFTSREIITTIAGSNVKEVKEWTFPFDFFKGLMIENGFDLTSTGFLTPTKLAPTATPKGKSRKKKTKKVVVTDVFDEEVPVPQTEEEKVIVSSIDRTYENLPEQAKVFSGLQRFFVFTKKGGAALPKLGLPEYVPVSVGTTFIGLDFSEVDVKLYPVAQDNSAIFNCYQCLIDEQFRSPVSEEISSLERSSDLSKKQQKESGLESIEKRLYSAKDKIRRKLSSSFRTKDFPEFLRKHSGSIPEKVLKKYGSLDSLISAIKDLKKEIPALDALQLFAMHASIIFKDKVNTVLVSSNKVVTTTCTKTNLAFLFYQGYKEDLELMPLEERSGLLKQYYPMILVQDGEEFTSFDTSEEPAKTLISMGCSK